MRVGSKFGLAAGLAVVSAVAAFVYAAGREEEPPAPPVTHAAVAPASQAAAAKEVKSDTDNCCREGAGSGGAHDASKCAHAKSAASANEQTAPKKHPCPYLAAAAANAAAQSAEASPKATRQPDKVATVYTCPMHPEVKSAEKGRCPKCGMFLEPAR